MGETLQYFKRLTLVTLDVFYLESYCQLSSSKVESKELNENMYLVVRSLKNNNQKIVSDARHFFHSENLQILQPSLTIYIHTGL